VECGKGWRVSIEAAFDGRLGSPPRSRTSATGKAWTSFSLAVKNDVGTEWINVSAFNKVAAELPTDLEKGERLYVEGKLKGQSLAEGWDRTRESAGCRQAHLGTGSDWQAPASRRRTAANSEELGLLDGAAAGAIADDLIPL